MKRNLSCLTLLFLLIPAVLLTSCSPVGPYVGIAVAALGGKKDKDTPPPTALPAKASNPTPAHGTTDVSTTVSLVWSVAGWAESYDVYFGTDALSIANATRTSTEFKENVSSPLYTPGILPIGTQFFWRIDSVNSVGTTRGDVWSFTTAADTIHVHGRYGDDTNNGLSWGKAVKTIQKGLDLAGNSDWKVLVADGTYTGSSNRDLDFHGKAVYLRSVGGSTNCVIDCESSGRGFWFHNSEDADSIVKGFTIQNGRLIGQNGAGIYCLNSSSPTIRSCIIQNCHSVQSGTGGRGGGIHCFDSSSPTIIRCLIVSNSASDEGGGICSSESIPAVINCLIAHNSAGNGGGGIFSYTATIIDSTIVNNLADHGGGAYCIGSTMANTIVWGNTASSSGNQIYVDSSTTALTCCCYANGSGDVSGSLAPANCTNDDPQFLNLGDGGYRLLSTSPCIDTGDNSSLPGDLAEDILGAPRIVDGNNDFIPVVDIGAFEYQGTIHVSDATGNDANDGLSWATAVRTIQTGLNLAIDGWTVLVADSTYTGTSNRELDFGAKAIYLKSLNGVFACVIDCENSAGGFYFHSGETRHAVVDGFTIQNGKVIGRGPYENTLNASARELEVFALVNEERRKIGLKELSFCEHLGDLADGHSDDMCDRGFFGHLNPESEDVYGRAIAGHAGSYTFPPCYPEPYIELGECIAYGQSTPEEVVSHWIGSPEDRNSILDSECTYVGIGNCASCGLHWTLVLGTANFGRCAGGGISCVLSSPTIKNCVVDNCRSDNWAGGGIFCYDCSPSIVNCKISGGWAWERGGAIFCMRYSSPDITNCAIEDNWADTWGAGVFCDRSSPSIISCTIVNNSNNPGGQPGGGICCVFDSSPVVFNTIIWGNSASGGSQIYTNSSTVTVNYCCYADGAGAVSGTVIPTSCVNSDPLFVVGPKGSYYLSQIAAGQGSDSPCLDAGSDTAANLGSDMKTTRTDTVTDSGQVDIGCHYDP